MLRGGTHSIDARLHGNSGVVHVAADVAQDLARGVSEAERGETSTHHHTLALRPSLQMASQSALDCSEAAGDVTSI